MFLSIHAATGMLIGEHVRTSLVAFLLGLLSHFLWDAIPHGDDFLARKPGGGRTKAFYYIAFIDILVATTLTIVFYEQAELASFTIISWAICGAVIPDIVTNIYQLARFKPIKNFNNWHRFFHHPNKAVIRISLGLVFQATILIFVATLLFLS